MSVASKTSLSQFFRYCLEKKLPVAFYRLPDTDAVKIVAQKYSALKKFVFSNESVGEKGFLFSPFQKNEQWSKIMIQPDIFCDEENLPELNFAKTPIKISFREEKNKAKLKEATKVEFENLVQTIKQEIRKNNFSKVVAARVVKKNKPKNFDALIFFQSLCKKYPAAFISLVYTREYGLWVGASPEVLLSANKNEFKTFSLAGTKANTKRNLKTAWGDKEKEEQKIVSHYITKSFSSITKIKPLATATETIAAGNLLHLRTTFSYRSIPVSKWQEAVTQLHPTPAVAGLPKQKAINFILQHEKTPRNFYSGYLGPVNLDKEINLFVNLRCMQILKNKLAVYVGCGITAHSKPNEEWKESKMKLQTLLQVLRK